MEFIHTDRFILTDEDYVSLTERVKDKLELKNTYDVYIPVQLSERFYDKFELEIDNAKIKDSIVYQSMLFNKENTMDDTILIMFENEQAYLMAKTVMDKLLQ